MRQLLGAIALGNFYTERLELVTHGRVDAAVGTRHPMPCCTSQGGNAAHEGAANTKNMNVHQGSAGINSDNSVLCRKK
jgi:hypothetical protein